MRAAQAGFSASSFVFRKNSRIFKIFRFKRLSKFFYNCAHLSGESCATLGGKQPPKALRNAQAKGLAGTPLV
jgi:hypothetical protein